MQKYKYAENIRIDINKIIKDREDLRHVNPELIEVCVTSKHFYDEFLFGKIKYLNDQEQFFINKSFILLLPPIFSQINENLQKLVLIHELSRISIDGKLLPRDFSKFNDINREFNINWLNELQEAQNKIKILKEKEKLQKKIKKQEENE